MSSHICNLQGFINQGHGKSKMNIVLLALNSQRERTSAAEVKIIIWKLAVCQIDLEELGILQIKAQLNFQLKSAKHIPDASKQKVCKVLRAVFFSNQPQTEQKSLSPASMQQRMTLALRVKAVVSLKRSDLATTESELEVSNQQGA